MLHTFARDFDKQLTPNTAIHYQAGRTYDVADDLAEEVRPFVEAVPAADPPHE
jgi:hypothetical protein